jgi:histidinol dehydrogenase
VSRVAEIVADVREGGDESLARWCLELDGCEPALASRSNEDIPRDAVARLIEAVRTWHEAQRPADLALETMPGVSLERRWVAIASVGIYVPKRLVSTLIMCAVPALAAGVERIVVATPPDGAPLVAAAAEMLGIEEVWAIGGPQAIAALAYGTEKIPCVDKIVGPGNSFVEEAKRLVSKDVAIDLPAGPSEVVVLLGNGGDRSVAELEVAAQQEHGADSICRIVDGTADLEAAFREVEAIAPEHLVLLGEAESLAPRVRNAGAVFVGPFSPVAAGDYGTGGNHVLPTRGWGRTTGGIGLETFLKPITIQKLSREGLTDLRPTVEALAGVEEMPAHARSVQR